MRVLAKFIGFIVSRPYAYDDCQHNSIITDRQLQLRNLLLPPLDLKSVLHRSFTEKKIVITIPWIVQFLSMLDYVSLRLDYYRDLFCMLFELYIILDDLNISSTTKFILRSSLGWLFEHPNVPEVYYEYRQNRRPLTIISANNTNSLTKSKVEIINPLMESIIVAACPFLCDLRVSIMPLWRHKQPSRTGHYRHITTKMASEPTILKKNNPVDNKKRLFDAFLQSQSLSVRKTIEFVSERVTSAIIKDFQFECLLAKKKEASQALKKIKSREMVS